MGRGKDRATVEEAGSMGEHREASELSATSHLPANGTEWQGPSRMVAGFLPCPGMLDEASRLVEAETSLETGPKERSL